MRPTAKLCGIFILLPLILVAVNYLVDVDYQWRSPPYLAPKYNWKSDQMYLVSYDNFDERAFSMAHLKVEEPFDVMILGSSRMLLVDSNMFDGRKIFNACVSTAVIQDYISAWQLAKNVNRIPKFVIIALDPWIFNKNNKMFAWKKHDELYNQFITGEKLKTLSVPEFRRNFFDLLSIRQFSKSIQWMFGKKYRLGLNKIFTFNNTVHGIKSDGSQIYYEEFMKEPSLDLVRAKAKNYTSTCDHLMFCNWDFDFEMYQHLVSLLQDIHRNGVKTLVIFAPYQTKAMQKMLSDSNYGAIIRDFKNTVNVKLINEKGVSFEVCDAMDPAVAGCNETEFVDGVHPRLACVKKVMNYCQVTNR